MSKTKPTDKQDYDFNTPAKGSKDTTKGGRRYSDKALLSLDRFNRKYCALYDSGKYRVMSLQASDTGKRWNASSRHDFLAAHENQLIENPNQARGAPKLISLGAAWQTWPDRKTAFGTCFHPSAAPGALVGKRLNLWTGWTVTPEFGDCDLLMAMIRDDLCAGNEELFDYVINWCAWKVQNPGELPEVALVFVGNIGAGKTTFGELMAGYFGPHGMCIDDMEAIVGDFNGHLESLCLLYADEAMWGGDKKAVGPLKKLITDKERDYHHKGITTYKGINRIGLILGSNEEWVVPAGKEERRYCVSRVSPEHYAPADAPADSENRIYWNKLHRELASGGREAFLFDMLHRELGDWHPRDGVPKTEEMAIQKAQGLAGIDKWYHDLLRDAKEPPGGNFSLIGVGESGGMVRWSEGPIYVKPYYVVQAYAEWLEKINKHTTVTTKAVLAALKRYGWEGGDLKVKQERAWKVPRFGQARRLFGERLGDPKMFG